MSDLTVLEFHGGPRERGGSHGEQLREEIPQFYEAWLSAMSISHGSEAGYGAPVVGSSEADYLAFAAAHLPASREYAPELVVEVEGVAEGSGFPFEKLFLLNCFDEATCHGPALLHAGLHGCTTFAATGRATSDGTTYVGQGWDMPEYYPPYLFRLLGGNEPDALVIGHPGILAGTGINEHGLSIVWNTLKSADAGVGVPATFVVRKALQARELSELVGNVITSRRGNGMNFIAADEDAAVNLELSATRYHFTYSHGILGHANHFEAPEFLALELDLPAAAPDTLLRSARMRELLQRNQGTIDRVVLEEILRDHAGGPGSICRHHARGFTTLISVIYVPRERKMLATNGNPCMNEFVEYALEPTTAGAAAGGRADTVVTSAAYDR
jgi:isopenicillin-N N-acyltransferase-like protein